MIVASSAGRGGIAREVAFRHGAFGTVWAGDTKDKMADGIQVQLVQDNLTGGIDFVLQTAKAIKARNSNQGIELEEETLILSNNVG
jgi:hypothetical protein